MSDRPSPEPPIPAQTVLTVPAMISVVQTVYYHPVANGGDTEQFDSRYSQVLTQDEQPYVRVVHYDNQKWVLLDHGWIEPTRCSCLIIEHLTKPPPGRVITGDEGVVEIGIVEETTRTIIPVMVLLPGTSLRLAPVDMTLFRVTCRQGSARCRLTLLPS